MGTETLRKDFEIFLTIKPFCLSLKTTRPVKEYYLFQGIVCVFLFWGFFSLLLSHSPPETLYLTDWIKGEFYLRFC